jgi:hypothetical protein
LHYATAIYNGKLVDFGSNSLGIIDFMGFTVGCIVGNLASYIMYRDLNRR